MLNDTAPASRSLTDKQVRAAKPADKAYKLSAGRGMYLLVQPNGTKAWRLDYRHGAKRKTLALGTYPPVTLAVANDRRDEARKLLTQGVDPGAAKKAGKARLAESQREAADTFKAAADEWMAHAHRDLAPATIAKSEWLFREFLLPALGAMPIREITPGHVRDLLRKVEASGKRETALRLRVRLGQVYRWLVVEGRVDTDPTAALRGLIRKPKARHHAALTEPKAIGELMRRIYAYDGHAITRAALKLSALLFVRPGELRHAEWPEFDLDGGVWRVPGHRMKVQSAVAHVVPLAPQAVAILRELREQTGGGRFVFPSLRPGRPMSENTVTLALRGMGYAGDNATPGVEAMTAHGFRAMASSRLNEAGWRADAIERQLAHAESDKVRESYSHGAQFLDERTRMMAWWADYLDSLRTGVPLEDSNVVSIRRTAA